MEPPHEPYRPHRQPHRQPYGPHEAIQINDVFASLGAGSTVTRGASLTVTASLPAFFYVTVIDNESGDSFYVPPSADEVAPAQ